MSTGEQPSTSAKTTGPKRRTPWQLIRQTARRSPSLLIGGVIIACLGLMAAFAPVLSPFDPLAVNAANAFQPPDAQHWFGTDELGRDLYSRTLYGARASLLTGLFATVGAALVGVPLGLMSGYFGRWADALIMRAIDIQIAVPAILLALIIIVMAGRGFVSSIVAVGIASIPVFARIVRASTMSIKEEEYVSAVKALGAGHIYTMVRTILPNAWGPIIVQMVITASVAILLEAALSFLGLGTQPPTPTWGDALRTGKGFLANAPYYAILPGVMLTMTVLALDLMGRGLQKFREGTADTPVELEARA
ncbi:ABC transporter permease [Pseudactinotalea sp. Z1732]|uniref:ABC transporter permease n=1 Tax=Micrococcales TaxID=85006 RepID=UPI003C7C4B08